MTDIYPTILLEKLTPHGFVDIRGRGYSQSQHYKSVVGESVDSGTVVPGKRKIFDFFLMKLFAYFFFLISLAKQFRSLKKHWQA